MLWLILCSQYQVIRTEQVRSIKMYDLHLEGTLIKSHSECELSWMRFSWFSSANSNKRQLITSNAFYCENHTEFIYSMFYGQIPNAKFFYFQGRWCH